MNREEIENTKSLAEAVHKIFGNHIDSRSYVLKTESMTESLAQEYDAIGKNHRQETYQRIAEDFKKRTGCYGVNFPRTAFNVGTILDIGCGSGLLTLELAEQTNGNIIGLDLSEEMISLAKDNLARRSQEKTKEIKEFWKKIPEYCKPSQQDLEKLEKNHPLLERINYVRGSVYELEETDIQNINYVVCRNALHRFQYPERALEQMYTVLSHNGKIYIRDLRRDANWQIILKRIGEQRWQTQTLVQDYICAMASMFTTEELEQTLLSLGIKEFNLSSGEYLPKEISAKEGLNEYAEDTEYVCIITKT